MPELPEVETVVRQLQSSVEGIRLRGAQVFDPRLGHLTDVRFQGLRVKNLRRYGKYIVFGLTSAKESLSSLLSSDSSAHDRPIVLAL